MDLAPALLLHHTVNLLRLPHLPCHQGGFAKGAPAESSHFHPHSYENKALGRDSRVKSFSVYFNQPWHIDQLNLKSSSQETPKQPFLVVLCGFACWWQWQQHALTKAPPPGWFQGPESRLQSLGTKSWGGGGAGRPRVPRSLGIDFDQ